MARRAFLHIGTPKSGTTYLQGLWWHHHVALAHQGLLLPGADADAQFQAAAVVRANEAVLATMGPRQRGAWKRLLEESAQWSGDVLLSQEQLVETGPDQVAASLAQLGEVAGEVHLVITARDLVRQVPSAWQQRVKHGSPSTLRRFCERLMKDDPAFNFWRHQDVPRILERWAASLDPDRVHVIPLPRPGADRTLLWKRTSALLGVDPSGLDTDVATPNETLAPAEIAFHRLVNTHFDNAHLDVPTSRRVKAFMEPRLVGRQQQPSARLLLPADQHRWFVERGNRLVDDLVAAPWHVVGDLDDLRPDPDRGEGVDPDEVPDAEVASVAAAFVAALIDDEATRPTSPETAPETPKAPAAPARQGSVRRLLGRTSRQRGTNAQ